MSAALCGSLGVTMCWVIGDNNRQFVARFCVHARTQEVVVIGEMKSLWIPIAVFLTRPYNPHESIQQ